MKVELNREAMVETELEIMDCHGKMAIHPNVSNLIYIESMQKYG